MKRSLAALLCLLAWSQWVVGFAVDMRSTDDGRALTKQGEPPESELSSGTFQSDMKLGVYENEVKERIQDAKAGRTRRKAFANLNFRWPNGIIPYVITASSAGESEAIENAMHLWESQTCIKFEPYRSDLGLGHQDYISFMKGDGCWSYIGKQGTGAQDISIGSGCDHLGTTAHEIAHAMGFHHEQSRSDRDDYVNILYENVRLGLEDNFVKYEAVTQSMTHGVPYDPTSVMHYNTRYFSSNGKPTIITINPLDQFDLGQREHLSFYDVYLANIIYDCLSDCSDTLSCLNGGYEAMIAGTCKCTCPPGFDGALCEVDNSASISKCRYELTEASGTIKSPNYPSNYDNGLKCAWYIKGKEGSTVTLTFDFMDVEDDAACSWDAVAVRTTSMFSDDAKFCGRNIPSAQVSTNEMMVVLTTDVSYNYQGFVAHYVIEEPSSSNECTSTCGGTLTDVGCLTSPKYPDNYDNNVECTWTIEVASGSRVSLDITELGIGSPNTKCLDDALQVSLTGGDISQVRPLKVCGTDLPSGSIMSLGNTMTLRFTTDDSYQNSGFRAAFRTLTL
ncbi:blastula protease 10-like [Acanthaster planci]|uniref:Metalloendopeptidase n=1 Tax=Acanthaster planci TaxID=133434 RepID=A0A8B7Z7X7_ACAPL|nr:blastula protease 10-like [Acanthaster planci]